MLKCLNSVVTQETGDQPKLKAVIVFPAQTQITLSIIFNLTNRNYKQLNV